MDKAFVVAMRNALLNDGKNRAVRVVFDNGIVLSQSSDLIIWDDDKEIIVGFTASSDGGSYIAGLPIEIISSKYENIQFIIGNTNVDKLEEVIDSLKNAVNITDDAKEKLIEWFSKLYSHKYQLSTENYDPIDIIRDKKEKKE